MKTNHQDYASHLGAITQTWKRALEHCTLESVQLHAGLEQMHFEDDHGPNFVANPHITQWLEPTLITPGSRLVIGQNTNPVYLTYAPQDYWHAVPDFPTELSEHIEVKTFTDLEKLHDEAQQLTGFTTSKSKSCAHIGSPESLKELQLESSGENHSMVNPADLMAYVHYYRAVKTDYELMHMREASIVGAKGHLAAANAFYGGGSEFDIHLAYLKASHQVEGKLPYGNIVALNEHGAILHYQHQEQSLPDQHRSLLIDAGGSHKGYASDITRTHVGADTTSREFAQLIDAMQAHQEQIIDGIQPGLAFKNLHVQMHEQLAELLVDQQLVTCSAEQALADNLTYSFCPHGLGHLLGIQVHDVGGHMSDHDGTPAPPPEKYPTLRFNRDIEIGQVFTIEPGIYFMPYFLNQLREQKAPINWAKVERLTPYGGIRIEDNLLVTAQGSDNLTREAFDSLS